jgi:hypothetical protein
MSRASAQCAERAHLTVTAVGVAGRGSCCWPVRVCRDERDHPAARGVGAAAPGRAPIRRDPIVLGRPRCQGGLSLLECVRAGR